MDEAVVGGPKAGMYLSPQKGNNSHKKGRLFSIHGWVNVQHGEKVLISKEVELIYKKIKNN